jgi:hypothetical protein
MNIIILGLLEREKKKKMMPVMEEEVLLLQLQSEMIGFRELLWTRG